MKTISNNKCESAIIVHVELSTNRQKAGTDIAEFIALVKSAGIVITSTITSFITIPNVRFLIGKGKIEEIRRELLDKQAQIVLVNFHLTPSQERNLSKELNCCVIDRAGLILDIFAKRARTFEGKLQVELAQLEYLSTRLVRGWLHLERQKGGIGLRGPGETQLETDRRLIRKRIKIIKAELNKVKTKRELSRKRRSKYNVPLVALIGYTNSGKSTLFNLLTDAKVYVADQLFATLDPTIRQINISSSKSILLADTVGFIKNLPHELIDAFKATLEEVKEASLILHVVDVARDDKQAIIEVVDQVLNQIGVGGIPKLMVFNKIDQIAYKASIEELPGTIPKVWVSAISSEGIDLLLSYVERHIYGKTILKTIMVPYSLAKLRSKLYADGVVRSEILDPKGFWLMKIDVHEEEYNALKYKIMKEKTTN